MGGRSPPIKKSLHQYHYQIMDITIETGLNRTESGVAESWNIFHGNQHDEQHKCSLF